MGVFPVFTSTLKTDILRAITLKAKVQGKRVLPKDMFKNIPIPIVVSTTDGTCYVGLRGAYKQGKLTLFQIHDIYETSAGSFCKLAGASMDFPKGTWTAESLAEFFGVYLPQFVSEDTDLDELAVRMQSECSKRAREAARLLAKPMPEPTLPPLGALDGHLLMQQPPSDTPGFSRVPPQAKKRDVIVSQEERRAYLLKCAQANKIPAVRVYAALIQRPEGVAGPERDRILKEIRREFPELTFNWTLYSSRRDPTKGFDYTGVKPSTEFPAGFWGRGTVR